MYSARYTVYTYCKSVCTFHGCDRRAETQLLGTGAASHTAFSGPTKRFTSVKNTVLRLASTHKAPLHIQLSEQLAVDFDRLLLSICAKRVGSPWQENGPDIIGQHRTFSDTFSDMLPDMIGHRTGH